MLPTTEPRQLWSGSTVKWLRCYFGPYVVIAYTQEGWLKDPGDPNFTCAYTYWPADQAGGIFNNWRFVNPEYPNNNAGLPDIDVSPNDSTNLYYGAIAFVQEVDQLWQYEVWVCAYFSDEAGGFYEVENPQEYNRANILPSIAIHYENEMGAHYASVTMLESKNNFAPSYGYRPWATIFNLDDGVQKNIHWVGITTDIDGLWVPLQSMAVTDPGPRTDIVMLPGGGNPVYNNYFAGYCDAVDGTADHVYVTWGNAADY